MSKGIQFAKPTEQIQMVQRRKPNVQQGATPITFILQSPGNVANATLRPSNGYPTLMAVQNATRIVPNTSNVVQLYQINRWTGGGDRCTHSLPWDSDWFAFFPQNTLLL